MANEDGKRGGEVEEGSTRSAPRLSTLLKDGKGVVLDGGMATYLETLGADISSTPLWSAHLLLTSPTLITRAHLTYFHAGARIALTTSYQASLSGLTTHLDIAPSSAHALIQKSVDLAFDARRQYSAQARTTSPSSPPNDEAKTEQDLLIAGSIGPYGATLANGAEYTGLYAPLPTAAEFTAFHLPRIATLVASGAHFLAFETLPSYAETRALTSLLTTRFPDVEAMFTFTLRRGPTEGEEEEEEEEEICIPDGTPLATVTAHLASIPSVMALGVNCVAPSLALKGLRQMRKGTTKPLVAYPNAGETWNAETRAWEGDKMKGAELRMWTRAFWDAGARAIGGCCGVGPEEVRVVAEVVAEIEMETEEAEKEKRRRSRGGANCTG